MKNFLYFFLLLPFCAYAQSADQNYIMSITYKFPYEYTRDVLISGPDPQPFPLSDKIVNITYYDGLGRPSQQIGNGQSNNGKDIITHIEYDSFGRQAKEYLPYEGSNFSGNYNTGALTGTLNFYSNPPNPNSEATNNPFSEKLFEPSPLNRVLKQGAPGNAWAVSTSANPDHTIKFEYQGVSSADIVKLYRSTATWDNTSGLYTPSLTRNGNYQAGQLYKAITKDENWTSGLNHTIEEFKDKEGKIILKRTYNSGVPHDTYYVYDQYGNLSYVLPPLSDGSGSLSDLNEVCYQYRYDNRNRLVEKKLPGKQWEFIVYDNLDRVIATGPALSPFSDFTGSGWLFTKYDTFGRIVYTGWMPATVTNNERASLQAARNMQTSNLSETKSVSDNIVSSVAFRYTNTAWPTSGYHVLTVNYYDDYDYPGAPTSFPDVEGQPVYYNLTVKPKGLPTGTWKRVPNLAASVISESSYSLYDSKDRAIRLKTTNYLGGYAITDNKLDFTGKVVYSIVRHSRAGVGELYVKDSYTYSNQDRLLTHIHQIGENGVPQLLTKNEYDELGRLIVKRTGGTDLSGNTSLQKVDYAYNIKGWLKEINKANNLIQPGSPDDLFAFKINYETVENTIEGEIKPLYNGNISETFWRSSSNDIIRSYGYKYDNLNRLKRAVYQKSGMTFNSYDEEISYDRNGNITDLVRNGAYDGDFMALEIDRLVYTYHPQKKNQLMKVLDYTFSPQGFKDDSLDGNTDPEDDYDYDAHGNMILDQNKGITQIIYNHLNLPTKIVFGSESNKIEYLYDAAGKKVQKLVTEAGTPKNYSYLQGFQYKGKALLFFPTAEGYVNYTPAVYGGSLENQTVITPESYNYVFNYTDHLGNIRLSYGLDPATNVLKIIEENHYYPFGLKHTNYSSDWNSFQRIDEKVNLRPGRPIAPLEYKYKYNGKEFQDELGLNFYDYGARNYDPAIGRWMNIDPLAEQLYSNTPYNYVSNNPLNFIDPDGRSGIGTLDEKNKTVTISSTMYFYGGGASKQQATDTAANIQKLWNAAGGTIDIDGITYAVQFAISGEYVSENDAKEMAKNNGDNAQNNFVRVENGSAWDATSPQPKSSFYDTPGNSGFLLSYELSNGSTDAHEFGHGLGWYEAGEADGGRHDATIDNGVPGIMSPRGTPVSDQYGYGGQPAGQKTMSPYRRGVLASDIMKLNIDTKTLKASGTVNVGTATNNIYNANGTVKTP
ncbi:DUF6443 domain-containing protein [Flavobacterium sp. Leaf359]|uniref:DUF6443 domain-containing protein n=1 Tax=Flavobacterium sp. Leaf359 TaxID=1736351 RepID=UPI0009EC524E|nr:DUF6443 domain-containing protein [Flavobacterium sp. Leaf359]